MTNKNYRKAVGIGIISLILFLTGSVQAYLHYYNKEAELLSVDNLRALSIGAFLLLAEFVFLYGDIQLMGLKSKGKRLVVGICLGVIALTMAWTIGSEFAASLTEKKAVAGMELAAEFGAQQRAKATTRRDRRAADASAKEMAATVIKEVVGADVRAYLVNFLVAMIAFVIFQFCDEKAKRRRVVPAGDALPGNPALQARVEKQIGLAPATAKAYAVDGGWAIWSGGDYRGFVKHSDLAKDQ
jgi:hypothetical protein